MRIVKQAVKNDAIRKSASPKVRETLQAEPRQGSIDDGSDVATVDGLQDRQIGYELRMHLDLTRQGGVGAAEGTNQCFDVVIEYVDREYQRPDRVAVDQFKKQGNKGEKCEDQEEEADYGGRKQRYERKTVGPKKWRSFVMRT